MASAVRGLLSGVLFTLATTSVYVLCVCVSEEIYAAARNGMLCIFSLSFCLNFFNGLKFRSELVMTVDGAGAKRMVEVH